MSKGNCGTVAVCYGNGWAVQNFEGYGNGRVSKSYRLIVLLEGCRRQEISRIVNCAIAVSPNGQYLGVFDVGNTALEIAALIIDCW